MAKQDGKFRFPEVEDDPRWKELEARVEGVRAKLSEVKGKIRSMETAAGYDESQSAVVVLGARALRGEDISAEIGGTPVDYYAELKRLNEERRVYEIALEQGEREQRTLWKAIAREIAAAEKSKYRDIVRRQSKALAALSHLIHEEWEFRSALGDVVGECFSSVIFPMMIMRGEDLDLHNPYALIHHHFKELIEHKYLTPEEVETLKRGVTG